MLPLEAPLRLIGGTTDFKLNYSLYVYVHCMYVCMQIVIMYIYLYHYWKFFVNEIFSFFQIIMTEFINKYILSNPK